MNATKLINIHRVKCQQCGEFNAQWMIIEASIRLWQKDDVEYRLLCQECAKCGAIAAKPMQGKFRSAARHQNRLKSDAPHQDIRLKMSD